MTKLEKKDCNGAEERISDAEEAAAFGSKKDNEKTEGGGTAGRRGHGKPTLLFDLWRIRMPKDINNRNSSGKGVLSIYIYSVGEAERNK